jgi:serine protease inhibitor
LRVQQQVALTVPGFTYESKFIMKKTLSGMGMPDAFLPGVADFSVEWSTKSVH